MQVSRGFLTAPCWPLQNGKFAVVITVDQSMPVQQNLRGRSISLVVLRAHTTNLDDLPTLIRRVLGALETLTPGAVVVIAGR